jgi:hypothetical protein
MTDREQELRELKQQALSLESQSSKAAAEAQELEEEVQALRGQLLAEFRRRWPILRSIPR